MKPTSKAALRALAPAFIVPFGAAAFSSAVVAFALIYNASAGDTALAAVTAFGFALGILTIIAALFYSSVIDDQLADCQSSPSAPPAEPSRCQSCRRSDSRPA